MGQPDGLVEWLREQIDEDERLARDASPGPWHVNAESDEVLAVDGITVAEGFALSGNQLRATTAQVARHDPARVLAQVAAHRAILHAHDRPHECVQLTGSGERSVVDGQPWELWEAEHTSLTGGACHTIRLLATVYADREGYREEWRPA